MEFHENIEEWKVLLKKNREAAEEHYYDNLFRSVIERFLLRSENLKKYRFLISLLGFSPQPIILFLKAIKPEKVLFIHSEETEQHLDTIQKWTGLTLSMIEKKSVDSSNPTDVYRAIKNFVLPRNGKEILLDITD